MNINDFFLYIVIPTFSLAIIFAYRYYYSKRDSTKMKFNLSEDILYTNIIMPVMMLVLIMILYANILQIDLISELKWELLSIFMIVILVLLFGIGIGSHVVSVMLEKSLQPKELDEESSKILYFFHWPFSHIMTFVSTNLVFYVILVMDLVKGTPFELGKFDLFFLTLFAVIVSIFITIIFIRTHTTKIMFYTLSVIILTVFFLLSFERITLSEHIIAYFFTILMISTLFLTIIYRYTHLVSEKMHNFLQSKFPDGDPIME